MTEKKQAFTALSKICLNNWHYIDQKVLSFNEGINFFTGHSGSGKSTVIDAMQIVLYADSNGRGFFNKAAADDSDRNLIEYLRGMVNIGENNESQYLRNKDFSTTIVLEFENTMNHEKQCAGVVFDVETATNIPNRLFFWHAGGILENHYRLKQRALTISEVKETLARRFSGEEYYFGPSNEAFRRRLYDVYLGGLDMDKFPKLFKRAIPFRMNIRLEDFVKEYICMEQDIHIEDMQESMMQYARMEHKINETLREIDSLKDLKEAYGKYEVDKKTEEEMRYQITKLEIMRLELAISEYMEKQKNSLAEKKELEVEKQKLVEAKEKLKKEHDELLIRLSNSGYENLKHEAEALNRQLDWMYQSKASWQKTAQKLKEWKETEVIPNQAIWNIERFEEERIAEKELIRLKEDIDEIRRELDEERSEVKSALTKIKSEEKGLHDELKELKQGHKAYPREIEEAKLELRNRLQKKYGTFINVHILADLLDVKDERWHNAIEGYMGNNKLQLIVEPKYAKDAMEIYRQMDRKKYYKAAVLDTEKLMEQDFVVREKALAKEVKAKEPYVKKYIEFFLGNVIECESTGELREQKIGITPDCVLYHSFRLQHINPENYTRKAYIGELSMRKRMKQIQEQLDEIQERKLPLQEQLEEVNRILDLEKLERETGEYMQWLKDIKEIPETELRQKELKEQIEAVRVEQVDELNRQMKEVEEQQSVLEDQTEEIQKQIFSAEANAGAQEKAILNSESMIMEIRRDFTEDPDQEAALQNYLETRKSKNYGYLKEQRTKECMELSERLRDSYDVLVNKRSEYIQKYPNRTFSTTEKDNKPYDDLLNELECDELKAYRDSAREQADAAVVHFKDDFIFKIRSAIKEAYQRKDELNRIISRLDFGKDKYKFVITPNKGADGRFYKMFMDDALQIKPTDLGNSMENQLNMFTMEHEEEYGDLMKELLGIFIPPEDATREEMDEARRNMEKYADYRTYLSFDMHQIVHGEKDMTIGLGKMIKKNSGGEGQNPLYVALLASFAQIYRVNLTTNTYRPPTLRLVVLDEAFSKMDAEKVASCISLIRGLGFQAIISATNDKIQNYLENVDKTFVYANPDKKHISIQEFEKREFDELVETEE